MTPEGRIRHLKVWRTLDSFGHAQHKYIQESEHNRIEESLAGVGQIEAWMKSTTVLEKTMSVKRQVGSHPES